MSYNEPNLKAARGEILHTFEEIHAAVLENMAMVIDDHRSNCENYADMVRKAHAIGKFGEHTVLLSSEEETPYFCLNRMYIDDDGLPHLSRTSVGGMVHLSKYGTLAKAIEAYNDPKNWMDGHPLVPITDVIYL